MFLRFSSTFCVAAASGRSIGRGFSLRKTVLTMKKISSRKAMSARELSGISLATFDLRLKPPCWIAIP